METIEKRRGRHTVKPGKPINNLRAIREAAGKTVQEIADYLQVSPVSVTQAELLRSSAIGTTNWFKLADYFDIDPRILKGHHPFVPSPENNSASA
jgi:transcriptional regulator with XRE-family HTH domain